VEPSKLVLIGTINISGTPCAQIGGKSQLPKVDTSMVYQLYTIEANTAHGVAAHGGHLSEKHYAVNQSGYTYVKPQIQ
jgi:hypothetical protein